MVPHLFFEPVDQYGVVGCSTKWCTGRDKGVCKGPELLLDGNEVPDIPVISPLYETHADSGIHTRGEIIGCAVKVCLQGNRYRLHPPLQE